MTKIELNKTICNKIRKYNLKKMNNSIEVDFSTRLKTVFDSLGVNANDVSKKLGVGHQKFYKLLSGDNLPNVSTILDLIRAYPEINERYLLRGDGSPLVGGKSNAVQYQKQVDLPYYETQRNFVGEPVEEYGKKVMVLLGDVDLSGCVVYEITDNSMLPQLHQGQKIVIRLLEVSEYDFLQSGIYVVKYSNYAVVRRIKENNLRDSGKLILYSDNEKFGMISLHRKDIISIYSVIQVYGNVE